MEEENRPASTVTVGSTLLARGTPLSITAPGKPFNIGVHDSQGRLPYRGLLASQSTLLIPTFTWAPGLYFVRSQAESSSPPSVVKVAIE
jgi:hypothetical protein